MREIKTISIDIETFSDIDLSKCGVYKYSESENFEILLFAYSINHEEVQVVDLALGEKIPEEVIKTVRFVLPQPKGTSNVTTQELINNYTTLEGFLVKLYFGESPDDDVHLKAFTSELAKMHLPMINFTEIDNIFKKTQLEATAAKITPSEDDDSMDYEQ